MKSTRGDPKKSGNAGAKSLKIGYRPIRDLEPDPVNPRSHSKKQVRQIAESIRTFGFNFPILVDRHDNIISGHGRLLACGELGLAEVPRCASITSHRLRRAPS